MGAWDVVSKEKADDGWGVTSKTDLPKEPSKPSVGRTAGLTARNAIEGLTALPGMVANIPGGIYNAGADLVQGYHAPSRDPNAPFRFSSMGGNISDLLTQAGLPNPETPGERLGSDIAQGVAGAGGGIGIAKALASRAQPALQAIGRSMAANPGKQIIGGAIGGAAAGGAREAGLPVPAQIAAGVAGGMVPFAPSAAMSLAKAGSISAPEQRALSAGYTLPPATMENPSTLSKLLGGWSGKVKSQQGASVKNQALLKQVAASEMGLPRDTVLDDNVFHNVRTTAGKAYEAVKQAQPDIAVDPTFIQRISGLGSLNSDLAKHFPELVKNDAITEMVTNLSKKTSFPTSAGIEAVKTLRFNATKNLQAIGDPEKNALGLAQRDAANALDDLVDRNLSGSGNPGLVSQYRAARQLIAKSHDIESATNTATGEIDARRLALLSDRGKPLTGGLAKVADVASAFPKATQMPSKFGGAEPLSILDILAASGSLGTGAMTGHLGSGAALAGATLSRPLVRALTLSPAYQRAIQARAPLGAAGILPGQVAIQSDILRNNQ